MASPLPPTPPTPPTPPVPPRQQTPRLRFDGIGKSFFGVPVLTQITFDVQAGRITAVVGENGAGKSTLMNLLGGNLSPDQGHILFEGRRHQPRSPAEARRAGIAFVHQELNLFPNLSLAENLALTDFPTLPGLPLIDRRALAAQARVLLDRVGLPLPPETPLDRLSAGERQLVEIARALRIDARVLILDEPTTSLTARESARLFEIVRRLRADGLAILFISHALGDVLREADDIVVLRDGMLVSTGPARSFDIPKLVTAMVGRELTRLFPARRPTDSPVTPAPSRVLSVQGVSQPGMVRDVTFDLFAGEILGVAGLMGAGRSELARILFGLDPCATGEILLDGSPLTAGPRRRISRGLAFLTEDRRSEGLCLEAAIADNLMLVTLREHAPLPWIRWLSPGHLRESIRAIRHAVRLTPTARDEQPARTLSGGNQQKVVLAKWLLARPKVLILDEPTRGIDVGAKAEIYQLIRNLADGGAGVLLISSELEELLGLCDRLLVMARGRLADIIPHAEFTQERVLRAALAA